VQITASKHLEILYDSCNLDILIKNAIKKNQFIESEIHTGFFDGNTDAGIPLLFACVINEPEDQSTPWVLEKVFHFLLKNKANPN
jgi:hypothetical protein